MKKDIELEIITLLTKLTQQNTFRWKVDIGACGGEIAFLTRISNSVLLKLSKERHEAALLYVVDYSGDHAYVFESTNSLADLFRTVQAQTFSIEKLLNDLTALEETGQVVIP